MRKFDSLAEVDTLTDEEALEIIRMAAEVLKGVIDTCGPYALDDCGDYLQAAVDNYTLLFALYHANDGDPKALHEGIVIWLKDPEWGGSDGEIRFDLFTERWQEEEFAYNQAAHEYWAATHPEQVRRIREHDYPVTAEPRTDALDLYDRDKAAMDGKHAEEWPDYIRRRVGKYLRVTT